MVSRWIDIRDDLPAIGPMDATATVIVAHVGYDAIHDGHTFHSVRSGDVRVSPASYLGADQSGPFFKSMINGRRLEAVAWMPLPEPPEVK